MQATPPSQLWLNDLDALGVVLDEIEEAAKKQEAEDAKQRKLASKRKVNESRGTIAIVQVGNTSTTDKQCCSLNELHGSEYYWSTAKS